AGAVRHVVFLFLVALLIALLLSPVVRGVQRVRMPRGFAVALVYLVFAVTLIAAIGALGTVVVNETKTAAKRVDSYFTDVNGRTGQVDADRTSTGCSTGSTRTGSAVSTSSSAGTGSFGTSGSTMSASTRTGSSTFS